MLAQLQCIYRTRRVCNAIKTSENFIDTWHCFSAPLRFGVMIEVDPGKTQRLLNRKYAIDSSAYKDDTVLHTHASDSKTTP